MSATPFSKDHVADYNKVLKYPKDQQPVIVGDKKFVWVPFDSDFGFAKAEVISDKGAQKFVKLDSGEERTLDNKDVHDMNPGKFEGVEDMSELGYLNEPSVLFNLEKRYNKDLIYTYSGLFLVAINPYKHLPIYTNNIVQFYCGKRRNEVAPHIFAIADTAYRSMLTDRRDQSLLITGESGAGKTENTKKVIQYIANIAGRAGGQGKLESQLIDLNPFLEAFGNAKTCRNNNSSRFGKFIKLEFNHAGNVAGASLKSYLLEKSRVVAQAQGERNYHIFYQLIAGASAEEKAKYHLLGPEHYNFLNKSGCYTVDRLNDSKEFEVTKNAMQTCDIGELDQDHIYRVIASILWLGNLSFVAGQGDAATLKSKEELNIVAELLSVSAQQLEDALIRPVIIAGNDKVQTHLNVNQAADSRDALVKALYGRLFLWLVFRINEVLSFANAASFIGVLDISGFEIFEDNSFEQLCINYTNEQLQQFFNNHMFQLEQDEYEAEKINWSRVDFKIDGQSTIDLIDRKPNGILVILDEESVFPNATDTTFLHKLYGKHQHNPAFQKPRFAGEELFIIKHYAGEVKYNTDKWLEKNKDPLQNDLEATIKSSTNKFVANLFSPALAAGGGSTLAAGARKKGAQFLTVGAAYKEQLTDLMGTLRSTSPHFVRCILPNHKQRPGSIEAACVLEQLRCNGVLEGIRITRMGWPNRIKYDEFLKRYYLLASSVPRTSSDPKGEVQKIIKHLNITPERVQFGLTKIFFRTGELARIEEMREAKIGELLVVIQSACRGWVARSTYRKLTAQSQAARIIQSNLTSYLDLRDSLWIQLFNKVKPLLKQRNVEAEIAEREKVLKETAAQLRKEQEEREALAANLKTLQTELSGISSRYKEAEESINALKRAKTSLENEKTELTAELDEERSNSTELSEAKRALEGRLRDLQLQIDTNEEQRPIIEGQLANLQKSLEQLKGSLEERDSRIASLESETNQLKTQLQDTEFELESKEDSLESLANKENNLKKVIAGLKAELDAAETKNASLTDARSKLEAKLKKVQADFDAEVETRGNVDEISKKLRDDLTNRETELDQERNSNAALAKAKKELEKKVKQIEDDLEAVGRQATDLESAKKNLTNKVQELEAKVQEDEEQIEELEDQKRKSDATIADLKKRLADAEATIARLEREKKALEVRVAELTALLDEELKDKEALSRDQKMLAEEIDSLNTQLDSEGSSASQLQKKLKTATKELKSANDRLRDEQEARNQADADVQRLTSELNNLRTEFDEAENRTRSLANKKRELETAYEETRDQLETLNNNSDNLKRQINNFKREADELNLTITETNDALEDATNELSKAKRTAETLRAELAAAQDELNRTQDSQRNLKIQLEDLEVGLQNSELKAANAEKARVKAESDVHDLQKQLEDQAAKILAAERANKKLQKKNSALLGEVDAAREAAKGDLEGQLNSAKEELRSLTANLESSLKAQRDTAAAKEALGHKLNDIQAQLDESNNTKSRLERQVKTLQEEMENLSEEIEGNVMEKFDDMKRAHSKALDALRMELDSAQNAARLNDEKNKRLQHDLEELTSKADNETARAASLERDLANVRTSFEELKRKAQQDADELTRANKDLAKATKAIHRLRQDVDDAQGKVPESELRRLADQSLDLQTQIEDERRARSNAEREREQLNQQLQSLRSELEEEQRARQTASGNLKKVQAERDDLASRLEDEEDETANLQNRFKLLSSDLENSRRQLSDAEEAKRAVEARVSGLENDLARARADLQGGERSRSELDADKRRVAEELENLKQELELEKAAKSKAETSAKKSKKEVATLRSDLAAAEQRNTEAKQQIKTESDERLKVESQLRDANNEREQLRSQLNTIESDKVMAERKYKETQIQLEDVRSEADTLQRNISKLERTAKKYQKIAQQAKEETERESRAKTTEATRASGLESELRTLKSQIADEQNKLRIANDEKSKLDLQLQTATRDVRTYKAQAEEAREEIERERKRAADRQRKMAKMFD